MGCSSFKRIFTHRCGYTTPGAARFILSRDREECFGKVENGKMIPSANGEVAESCWKGIPRHFKDAKIDEFRVMPNHVHGIVIIANDPVGNAIVGNAYMRSLRDRTKMLLSRVIQQYKASVTRQINSLQEGSCFKWQKSFYDHIIRNDKSLENLRQYIQNNPLKWELDRENPFSKNFNLEHDRTWKGIYD
jgi:REP-associated tyrosine transposase